MTPGLLMVGGKAPRNKPNRTVERRRLSAEPIATFAPIRRRQQ